MTTKFFNEKSNGLVAYIDHMGDDEQVCDAARVSMDKASDMFTSSQNERLIGYLAKHEHWSPFSHCFIKLRFDAPIFIARQLAKHQIGFAWNEVSRRYVNTPPNFWLPTGLRKKADSVKQGSMDTLHEHSDTLMEEMWYQYSVLADLYDKLVEEGVCAEQARSILPQSMMTQWVWSGSLYAWARMYNLRSDPHAQREVQHYASLVHDIIEKKFPISWRNLCNATRAVD